MALALLLSVQKSILNGLAVWCSNKYFTYSPSVQPFVIVLASDSADDSDTVANTWKTSSNLVTQGMFNTHRWRLLR